MRLYSIIFLGLLFLVYGCNSPVGSYQSRQSFDKALFSEHAERSFDYEGPLRNPVIVIHGFLGAKLRDTITEREIWGSFSTAAMTPAEMFKFAHPMAIGKPLSELKNHTAAFTMLDHVNIQLMGFSFSVPGYSDVIDLLQQSGYYSEDRPLPPGKNFHSQFFFYYDWRRDLPENAARLHEFILEKKSHIQEHYRQLYGLRNYDVQFDLIAHSMGGLLSRYYLQYGNQDLPVDGVSLPKLNWAGARHVEKLMVIGTPNTGYLDTLLEMVHGLRLAAGAPVYPPTLISTFPTYYQMLPLAEFRPLVWEDDPGGPAPDIFEPELWAQMKWGLASADGDNILKILLPTITTPEERRKIALDHQAKCLRRARQFTRAMSVNAATPEKLALFLFAGDAVNTVREVRVNRENGKLTISRYDAGDGKILTSSTRFDRAHQEVWMPFITSPIRWHAIYHVRAAHMGIMNSEEFKHNLRFNLLMMPTEIQKERIKSYLHQSNGKPQKLPSLPR